VETAVQIDVTPVAGSDLLDEKAPRFSELSELFQSKIGNLVKWTQLISADFSCKL